MKFKILFAATLFCLQSLPVVAQNPYQLKGGREAIWLGGGGAAIGISFVLKPHTRALSPEEVSLLDAGRIPAFDRFALRHYSAAARRGSDRMLYSAAEQRQAGVHTLTVPKTAFGDTPGVFLYRVRAGTVHAQGRVVVSRQ